MAPAPVQTTAELRLADAHRVAQVRVGGASQSLLAKAFGQLRLGELDASAPAFYRAALAVVAGGHSASADLAASYYGQARDLAGITDALDYMPTTAPDLIGMVTTLRINGPVSIKTAMAGGQLALDAYRTAQGKVMRAGMREVLNGGREQIIAAVAADRRSQGWARVCDSAPCAFCAMLMSRGPVYRNEQTAMRSHPGCGCTARPIFDGAADGGWSPDATALRSLWDANVSGQHTGPDAIAEFRKVYAAAMADPTSAVSAAVGTKTAASVTREGLKHAQDAATAAAKRLAAGDAARRAATAAEDAAIANARRVLAWLP